ncbi:bactofilin family protein [Polynucleobacter antarcticus]|uniref:Cell shape determination protein CcmA n=1 Tax=Polynucleobacter antarcticus TaxID=1743162 RepID=A0A6M9Q2H6_9BURK|nr:polymer-forming cytoskeletal protein [Polynucleobacter antarcticus]QKM62513.1 cell shape determination protein CcmA [Polynucleobacter antarcticus]
MFKSQPNKQLGKSVENFETIIGASIRIDGNLLLRSSVRIDGLVNGNILQEDGCDATVAIAKGATVTGDIRATHVIVSGILQGNIFSSDRVELLETAFVSGDVTYGTLGMQVGAKLEGKLRQADSDVSGQTADHLIAQARHKSNAS